MRKEIVFRFDHDDPNWKTRLEEAFYLLYNFCDRFKDKESSTCKAFNRIVNGDAFTMNDVNLVCNYGESVARIAEQRYSEQMDKAPWASSVMASAMRLRETTGAFKEFILEVQ
jgi:hypothetical protein